MKTYIDKAALVAEIEKRINENKKDIQRATHKHLEEYFEGYEDALVLFKEKFLDTLEVKEIGVDLGDPKGDIGVKWVQEEPASNNLEEAADKHLVEKGYLLTTNNGEHLAEVEAKGLFKAGAQWQKEQLMENAVEAVIHPYDGEIWVDKDLLSIYDDCQRVKLIIIKEK